MTAGPSPRLYLVDTSAQMRIRHPPVRSAIEGLIVDGLAATCATVDLEAGYSGRSAAEVRLIADRRRELFVVLPLSEESAQRARDVQVRMAARGQHRSAGVVDLLTAAVAEQHGASVLHYDADFEHIAAVTGQAQTWVVPRGSVP